MDKTKQFMENIFGNEQINFSCIGSYPKKINGYYNDNTINLLKQFNDQNFGIYFVVNSGGYKKEQITKINSVFIDLDCGRDDNKNYFPMDVVRKYKEEKLTEIHNFQIQPTYIIETRNGLHVYWLLNSGATIEQFKECQNRLIPFFAADKQIKNPNRMLRVPGYYWCKDPTNKFKCEIIEHNEVRYDVDYIINILPEGEKGGTINSNVYTSIYCTPLLPSSTNNKTLIVEKDLEKLYELLSPCPVELNSHNEVYDYLKKQDLNLFLGVSSKYFKCIFHDDNNPSAGIFINEDTGHYIYKCHSERCGFTGTIIECVEKLHNETRPDALNFLRKVYKITYTETDWQKRQKMILEENKRVIYSNEFEEFYPNLYKRIRNHLSELYILNDLFKDYVITENYSDSDNNALVFKSMREIAATFDKTLNNTQKKIGLFAFFGLLNKVKPEDIPDFLLHKAQQIKRENKNKYLTSFYSIPSYTTNTLSFGEQKAVEFKEKNYTTKGFSREMLLRGSGELEANRVFPQMEGEPISEFNEKISMQMEGIALQLIQEKGWTTEKEILDHTKLFFKGQQNFKETQLKRIIAEFLEKYGLKKQKLTKQLREKFNIPGESYFYIIYMENWGL